MAEGAPFRPRGPSMQVPAGPVPIPPTRGDPEVPRLPAPFELNFEIMGTESGDEKWVVLVFTTPQVVFEAWFPPDDVIQVGQKMRMMGKSAKSTLGKLSLPPGALLESLAKSVETEDEEVSNDGSGETYERPSPDADS